MKVYPKEKIRNVVLLGHGSSGKTTLTEAILFNQGLTSRMGRVEDGNTVSDYTKEEIARKFSIGTGLIHRMEKTIRSICWTRPVILTLSERRQVLFMSQIVQ